MLTKNWKSFASGWGAVERIGQRLEQQDKYLFDTIIDWFKGLAERLRKAYEGLNPDSEVAREAKKTIQQVDSLVQMWADMAVDAAENYRSEEAERNVSNLGEDVKYANRSFAEQVDEVKDKTFDKNNHVFVCNTPRKISQILSVPVLLVLMSSTHVYTMALDRETAAAENRSVKKKNFHDLGWTFVKNFPEIIKNPAALIKSTNDPNDCRFVVVTHEIDKIGRPVIAAMAPGGKGNFYNLEMVDVGFLSGYGADDFQGYIASAKTENRILYVQKNQTNKNTTGNLFSNNILSSDYSNNLAQFKKIVKDQFNGTVFQNTFDDNGDRLFSSRDFDYENIRYSDRDSSGKKLTEGQQKYFGDSKVRDEDGNLMVMYRGGRDEFTVFDWGTRLHYGVPGVEPPGKRCPPGIFV